MYFCFFLVILLTAYQACGAPSALSEPEPEVVEVYAMAAGTRFTSPGYPGPYDTDLQVTYIISAPAGHKIRFDAEFFDIDQGYDTMYFYDYVPHQGYVSIGGFYNQSGNDIFSLTSSRNVVHALFDTDDVTFEGEGFSILATSVLA